MRVFKEMPVGPNKARSVSNDGSLRRLLTVGFRVLRLLLDAANVEDCVDIVQVRWVTDWLVLRRMGPFGYALEQMSGT